MFLLRHSELAEVPVKDADGKPTGRVRLVAVPPLGRAALGVLAWSLLEDAQHPMNRLLCQAWAQAVRRDSGRAILDYAETRGEKVDSEEVMRMLKGSKIMGETAKGARS